MEIVYSALITGIFSLLALSLGRQVSKADRTSQEQHATVANQLDSLRSSLNTHVADVCNRFDLMGDHLCDINKRIKGIEAKEEVLIERRNH